MQCNHHRLTNRRKSVLPSVGDGAWIEPEGTHTHTL